MGIKITYSDTDSNEVLRETTLDSVDIQAFEYVALSPMDWIDNCFQNRARQAIDEVCGRALSNDADIILSDADKATIAAKVGIVTSIKQIPVEIKKDIVNRATFDSAETRNVKFIKKQ
jgi:hypothetical protein|tara:strand:- start:42 stop:395 length:354 start_codon:yes stop_codon:yes gene_type:complete